MSDPAPTAGSRSADLVLEGGGVKGLGLVGAVSALEGAGYRFARVAGTSAGAIVGCLIAAGVGAQGLKDIMAGLEYPCFRDGGDFLTHLGRVGQGVDLLFSKGIYKGEYLHTWIADQLARAGVRTFADLRQDDPESALPPERRYRLVVMISDVSRGVLVRLPWDYARYGRDPDEQPVADAVRASASLPFFFEPMILTDQETNSTSYLVDGGALSNFPIDVFDRTDGQPPRWPTLGVKLSARPGANQVAHRVGDTLSLVKALISTMMNGHDQMHLDDVCTQRRTIFVDTFSIQAADFDISPADQQRLFDSGSGAAGTFLASWNWPEYLKQCGK
jgi:NTE family protein